LTQCDIRNRNSGKPAAAACQDERDSIWKATQKSGVRENDTLEGFRSSASTQSTSECGKKWKKDSLGQSGGGSTAASADQSGQNRSIKKREKEKTTQNKRTALKTRKEKLQYIQRDVWKISNKHPSEPKDTRSAGQRNVSFQNWPRLFAKVHGREQ